MTLICIIWNPFLKLLDSNEILIFLRRIVGVLIDCWLQKYYNYIYGHSRLIYPCDFDTTYPLYISLFCFHPLFNSTVSYNILLTFRIHAVIKRLIKEFDLIPYQKDQLGKNHTHNFCRVEIHTTYMLEKILILSLFLIILRTNVHVIQGRPWR